MSSGIVMFIIFIIEEFTSKLAFLKYEKPMRCERFFTFVDYRFFN